MPYFDRFDICRAYYWFASLYHGGGGSPEYALFSPLCRMRYRPSPGDNGPERGLDEDENCRLILAGLIRRWRAGDLRDRRDYGQ